MKDNIKSKERLIFALDVPNFKLVQEWVLHKLKDSVEFYKIGMEIIFSGELFKILNFLFDQNKKVFLDYKFFDIPETIKRTVSNLKTVIPISQIELITVHGNDKILKAAIDSFGLNNPVLSVLHLTSLDEKDMQEMGFHCSIQDLIMSRSKRAVDIGCKGIVCAPSDLAYISEEVKKNLVLVTPGIRDPKSESYQDHKRAMSLEEAFKNGADYLVIGRPIREAKDPYQQAFLIQEKVENFFKTQNQ